MGQSAIPEVATGRYRVADLEIDVGTRRVSRGANTIALPGLSFSLLLELVHAAPNLVSIDELMRRVWPGLVVNPETVSQRIKLLRKALGDNPHAPRYVIGVRGHGYRLAVMPEPLLSGAAAPSDSGKIPETAGKASSADRPPPSRYAVLAAAALLFALLTVVGYDLMRDDSARTAEHGETPWQPSNTRSIAVLPFLSLSRGQDDDLIALGIPESVLHQLAQVPELQVVARTSSFALGADRHDAREIGRALDVHYLLEGSVQRSGEQLRVVAQLIDTRRGEHLWSLRFDETMSDLFALQDQIADAVVQALTGSVADATRPAPQAQGTASLDAWLYYQQGVRWLTSRRREDLDRAQQRFMAAARKDPGFSAAYVGQAEAMLLAAFHDSSEFWFHASVRMSEADRSLALSAIETAIELDPHDGDAYIARAWLSRDRQVAEVDYRRGLELNPNSAAGHERLARLLFFAPDAEYRAWDNDKRLEAFALIERARQLNPLAPSVHLTQALMLLYGRSDVAGAEAAILNSLEQDPNYFPALGRLGELRWCCQGEYAEAARYLEQALAVEPEATWARHFLIRVYLDMGDIEAAESVANGLPEGDTTAWVPIALARGDPEGAAALVHTGSSVRMTGLDASMVFNTLFLEELASGQATTVGEWLSEWVEVDLTNPNNVRVSDGTQDQRAAVGLGALLQLRGQPTQGNLVLESALEEIHYEAVELNRGYSWYFGTMPPALAWLGRNGEALDALQFYELQRFLHDWWYEFDLEPAFATLRADPRFLALRAEAQANAQRQHDLLATMQQRGEVPLR